MRTLKTRFMRFQLGASTVFYWQLDCMSYTRAENLSTFCLYLETLPETKIRGSELINLARVEISKQPNSQAVARVLLVAFSQIYSEN